MKITNTHNKVTRFALLFCVALFSSHTFAATLQSLYSSGVPASGRWIVLPFVSQDDASQMELDHFEQVAYKYLSWLGVRDLVWHNTFLPEPESNEFKSTASRGEEVFAYAQQQGLGFGLEVDVAQWLEDSDGIWHVTMLVRIRDLPSGELIKNHHGSASGQSGESGLEVGKGLLQELIRTLPVR